MKRAIKTAFCAACMEETKHEMKIEGKDNDITLICSVCGHFVKAPAGLDKEGLAAFLEEHKVANDRKIDRTPMMTQDEKAEALADLADEIEDVEEPTEEKATEEETETEEKPAH